MHIVHRANKNMTALKHIHYLPTFSFSGDWWLDQWMMLLHFFSPTLLHLRQGANLSQRSQLIQYFVTTCIRVLSVMFDREIYRIN